jgi:hypothetical protein
VITGKELIAAGAKPGKWFSDALAMINDQGASIEDAIKAFKPAPVLSLTAGAAFFKNIRPTNEAETENVANVFATMEQIMRTPVVMAGAVMPDACPAGPLGTIPVGGVVSSTEIHPGMHSADICCSMAISVFDSIGPKVLLDAVHQVTHFGPGGRMEAIRGATPLDATNPFLRDANTLSPSHFATQGDGNHFAYVGIMKSTGHTALVTHHGSRGPGAAIYKAGMKVAERYRLQLSPETLKQNAWIPADSKDGETYWAALQAIRQWTKESHFAIHDMAASLIDAKVRDRFFNEHNFVFRKTDGLFYHAKGATPAFDGWAADATDLTIIPLNMAEPILIVRGSNAVHGLGFSPHGAGRNFSRTQHKRMMGDRTDAEIFAEETKGIDARFFMGNPDISELPSAYKNANEVRAQILEYGLAEVVDEVIPFGCIMAGDWEKDMPWRKPKNVG